VASLLDKDTQHPHYQIYMHNVLTAGYIHTMASLQYIENYDMTAIYIHTMASLQYIENYDITAIHIHTMASLPNIDTQ